MQRVRTYCIALLVAFMLCGADASFALKADEIAIVVNSDNPESPDVAEYYCDKRHVPVENIIALPMPNREKIGRTVYERQIAQNIRDRLGKPDMKGRIKCLLTVRGVPLRIGPVELNAVTQQKRTLIATLLNEKFGELERLTNDFGELADPASSSPGTDPQKPFRLPAIRRVRDVTSIIMLQKAARAATSAQKTVAAFSPDSPANQRAIGQYRQFFVKWVGLDGITQATAKQLEYAKSAADRQLIEGQLGRYQLRLEELIEIIRQDSASLDIDSCKARYDALYEATGLRGLCPALIQDRHKIGDLESESSFDSELSLVLWGPYSPAEWQYNHLRAYPPEISPENENRLFEPFLVSAVYKDSWRIGSYPGAEAPEQATLMVCRLDGPSVEIAIGLIDKAIAAERSALGGAAYFDAQGDHKLTERFGMPGHYDQLLRDTADLIKQKTALKVTLDDKAELFAVDACPDTAIYCGWYSLRNYIDSFEFNTGAIGYHIASFEAETLWHTNPDSNIWCKRMLEKGITATVGAVAEPYLSGFLRPDQFFAELLGGEYCLVECFYRAKPFNSWMLVLLGDPLYRPYFIKTRGFRPAL